MDFLSFTTFENIYKILLSKKTPFPMNFRGATSNIRTPKGHEAFYMLHINKLLKLKKIKLKKFEYCSNHHFSRLENWITVYHCQQKKILRKELLIIFMSFKACVLYFFYFTKRKPISKIIKSVFIRSKKLSLFWKYSTFCMFSPSFPQFPESKCLMKLE